MDTAQSYGTENVVGKAVSDIRDRVIIATKVSPVHLRYQDVIATAERSLKSLNTDYIDLFPTPSFQLRNTIARDRRRNGGPGRFW